MRIKLAREAIGVWPDCADAFVLLAEGMPDPERRAELYRRGVEAAERTLGPARMKEDAGHFWGVLDTRPYMRARYGLADCLWNAGRRDEAVGHWRDLLRLNPNDNQGVRDILVPSLLELGRDEEAGQVLAAFEDDRSPIVTYSRALLEFRRGGEGVAAVRLLETAVKSNSHVPKYLSGSARLPERLASTYAMGGEDEATGAAVALLRAWEATPGAVAWLKDFRKRAKKARELKRRRP